ncbi:MAG: glycosyltransferase [Elusimicrobia bacterium]|nr:glycosyltransferase [Elusimicrobiota bacterium]
MMISIILPTINFSAGLKTAIENLRRQSACPYEIIVVDSSSDDGTVELAHRLGARTLTVARGEFDHGGTRTLAAKAAGGDILVFLTQDAVLAAPDVIARLAAVFGSGGKVGAAFGRQVPHPDADVFGRALRFFNYPEKSYVRSFKDRARYGIKTPFLSNSFAAYSRKALEEIGWFKDGLILGEDTYAGAKLLMAGYSIVYVADATVAHSHNHTPCQDFKRYFDIGVFHTRERWILDAFGNAEGEGLKYIFSSLKFLKDNKVVLWAPEFLWRTVLKYAGYKLGRAHSFLPESFRKRLSMHANWWR